MGVKLFVVFGVICALCLHQSLADVPAYCSLKPETGMCKGLFWRFYFDAVDGTCKTFAYGGCQGNLNNFKTQDECMKACSGVAPTQPVVG